MISLSIYGPIEDHEYWNECARRIQRLPSNVTAEHLGSLKPEQVTDTFACHDLFAFPTLGENFGHVIFESLRAGTPVLISDQTPWCPDPAGAVTVRPLDNIDAWAYALEEAARRNSEEQHEIRIATIAYANRYLTHNDSKAVNLAMFERAVSDYRRIAI
jgi:glycosyltransferase involved in cell wall biosynthesis